MNSKTNNPELLAVAKTHPKTAGIVKALDALTAVYGGCYPALTAEELADLTGIIESLKERLVPEMTEAWNENVRKKLN